MSKDPTEMTEEEIHMSREFEKKEIAFLEEREKLKKVRTCSCMLMLNKYKFRVTSIHKA